MSIKININAVKSCADEILEINAAMREDFTILENVIKGMGAYWCSDSASECVSRFNNIKDAFEYDSYKAVDNMARFMKINIGEQYSETEDSIRKAAFAFK